MHVRTATQGAVRAGACVDIIPFLTSDEKRSKTFDDCSIGLNEEARDHVLELRCT